MRLKLEASELPTGGQPLMDWGRVTRWSTGIDWLTASNRDDRVDGWCRTAWDVIRIGVLRTNGGKGHWEEAKRLGYTGRAMPGLFAGRMQAQGSLVVVSGSACNAFPIGLLRPHNVSRLDIQATFWGKGGLPLTPQDASVLALAGREGRRGGAYGVTLIKGLTGQGDTCYVGSRQSELYGRIYDKGLESGDSTYAGAVRLEFELKGGAANRAYNLIEAAPDTQGQAYEVLRRCWASRGIMLPPQSLFAAPFEPYVREEATSDERAMDWLARQVRPTVERLLTSGHSRDTILALLGLNEDWRTEPGAQ